MADRSQPVRFDMQSAERIARFVREAEARIRNMLASQEEGGFSSITWAPFKMSGGDVPPFGLILLTDFEDDDHEGYWLAEKPTTTFRRILAVNGATEVQDGKFGLCAIDGVVKVLYDGDPPDFGASCGFDVDEFSAREGAPGLTALGAWNEDQKWMKARIEPINLIKVQITQSGGIAAGGSGTAKVLIGTSDTDGGWDEITVKNHSFTIDENGYGYAAWINDEWRIISGYSESTCT